jgi:hypothetical protein
MDLDDPKEFPVEDQPKQGDARKPKNLTVVTSLDNLTLKSYKVPKMAGKIRVPKEGTARVSDASKTKKIDLSAKVACGNKNVLNAYLFVVDSGASSHMISDGRHLVNLLRESRSISQAEEGRTMTSVGLGTLNGYTRANTRISLKDVIVVPSLSMNIISVAKLCLNNYHVTFESDNCLIKNQKGNVVAQAKKIDGIYQLEVIIPRKIGTILTTISDSSKLWHERLGHLHMGMVKKMLPNTEFGDKNFKCESCLKGKMARMSFKKSNSKTEELFELVHSDVCGPFEKEAYGGYRGYRYFVTFIDDKSRYCFIYLLRAKSEVFQKFKEFEALVSNKYSAKIKTLRSDRGGSIYQRNSVTL